MGSQIADMTDGTEDGKFYINTVLGGSNVSRIYMTDTETIFNDSASDLDFRVESDNNTHALYVDGENGNVGINSTATNARLEVVATSGEVFRADANGGAYRVVVNQTGVNMNGLVGIGTTNPVSQFAVGAAGRRIEIDGGYVIRGFDRTASWAGIDFEASAYTFDCSTARMLDIAATGVIINEDGADADFRVESNALTNAFVIDGGNSGIGFGATPRSDLHASWTQLFVGKKGSILSERDTGGGIAQMSITDNLYMDSDTGSYAYIETDQASQYVQNAGVHTFNHAVSGSAGAAPTFIVQAQFADDEAVFNNGGANIDFRVESDTGTHLLFADAGLNRVGIGISAPASLLHLNQDSDGAIYIASNILTTGAVPAWSAARVIGEIHAGSGGDGGMLRLSAGGAATVAQKAGIDMSGYNTTDTGPKAQYAGSLKSIMEKAQTVFNETGAEIKTSVLRVTATPICCLWMLGKMLWLLVMQQLVMLFILMKTERETMYLELLMTVIM
jgi:hypothetical protein